MSKIFDALKGAQQKTAANRDRTAVPPEAERRRCPRRNAHVPVLVRGQNSAQEPFDEEAYSASVSEIGALLIMKASVDPGEILLLTNKMTQLQQECRVAYVSTRDPQSLNVAVQFAGLAPEFWRTPQLEA